MSLEELLRILWRHRLLVVATALIATLATYIVGRSLPDVYSARASLVVSSEGQAAGDFEATQSAQVLAKTYAELIQSENVAREVAARLPGDESGKELLDDMSFEPIEDTRLLVATAEDGTAVGAAALANTYARVFAEITSESLAETTQGSIALADEAIPPDSPIRPRPGLYAAVMFVLSLFAAGGLAVLRERLASRFGTEEEIGPALDLPVLTRIPMTAIDRGDPLAPSSDPAFVEAFRILWASLEFIAPHDRPASILITSPGPSEGKTVCCAALARVIAEQGRRVTLIEADLRRPRFSANARSPRGLTHVLLADAPFEEVVEATDVPDLYLLPAGSTEANPANLLRPNRLGRLLAEATAWSDVVLVDSPPVAVGPDAMLLSRSVDGCLLVISSRRTERDKGVSAARQLRRADANLLGVLLNEVRVEQPYSAYVPRPGRRRRAADALGLARRADE